MNGTSSCPLAMWAVRVTLVNVGNHTAQCLYKAAIDSVGKTELIIKLYINMLIPLLLTAPFHRVLVTSQHLQESTSAYTHSKTAFACFCFCNNCLSSAPCQVIILEQLSEELQGLLLWVSLRGKGGRQRFEKERRSALEDE